MFFNHTSEVQMGCCCFCWTLFPTPRSNSNCRPSRVGSSISLCMWCISLCSSITPVKSKWDVAVSAKLIGEFSFDMIPTTLEIVHYSVFILHDHHQTFRLLS